jgi:MoxR-like ATPase
VADASDLLTLQDVVRGIYVDKLVKEYIALLVQATRSHPSVYLGASPRGSLALFRTAQARALVHGRDYAMPDDVKAVAESVLAHRLVIYSTDGTKDRSGRSSIAEILEQVPVPGALP